MDELTRTLSGSPVREMLQLLLLLSARLLPIVLFSPLFGGQHLSRFARVGIALLLAAALVPPLLAGMPTSLTSLDLFGLALKEALLGFSLAILIRLLFELIAAFGAFIDLARGSTIARVLEPAARGHGSPLSAFFGVLFVALFLTVGGQRVLFDAIAMSLEALAPWEAMPAEQLGAPAALALVGLFADLFVVALQLCAPVMAVMFLTDVSLGLLNHVAPGVQAYFLGLTVKATLGLLILLLVFSATMDIFLEQAVVRIADWGRSF